jgi:hypothetical protein
MKLPGLPNRVRTFLLSETAYWVLPTPATLYLNKERIREPLQPPKVPTAEWSRRERHGLLAASEERLRNLEGKGPGLATVSAVIVGAIFLAMTGGWDDSTLLARVILASAAVYGGMSLLMPLYLVGPLPRHTVHRAEVEIATAADDPEETLADAAAEAAMHNDLRNLRLANLLNAARRELSYALALVLMWTFLVPVTDLLRREAPTRDDSASSAQAAGALKASGGVLERSTDPRASGE